MCWVIPVFTTSLLVALSSRIARAQTLSEMEDLHSTLLTNYNRFVRPSTDVATATRISIELSVGKINDIDETSGLFSLMSYITVSWQDDRLVWDPSTFSENFTEIHMPQNVVWKPELTLGNSFSDTKQLGFKELMVRVYDNGIVEWSVGDIFDTLCDYNTAQFPFDKQKCSLKFIVWGYTSSQLSIYPTDRKVVFLSSFFRDSAEWEVTSSDAVTVASTENAAVQFDLYISRRPGYFIMNVYVPVMLLTVLSTMAFILPTDSGERVGYSITCLLAIAVFLTIVSGSLPKTSNPLSVLGLFLMSDFIFSTAICICTIISIHLFYIESNNVPRTIRRFLDLVKRKNRGKGRGHKSFACSKCGRGKKNDNADKNRTDPGNEIVFITNSYNSIAGDKNERSESARSHALCDNNIQKSENQSDTNLESIPIENALDEQSASNEDQQPTDDSVETKDKETEMSIEDLEEKRNDEIFVKNKNEERTLDDSEKKNCASHLDDSTSENEDAVGEYTWQDVSKTFDSICFVLANASILVLLIIYMMFSNLQQRF